MSVSAGAENPPAVPLVGVKLSIEYTGHRQVARIKLCVLGMHMEDGVAEEANRRDRIDPLPEQVAGIEVAPHAGARDRAQLKHGFGAIDKKSRMRSEEHTSELQSLRH